MVNSNMEVTKELKILDYRVILQGELENGNFKGDVKINENIYRGVEFCPSRDFSGINCILQGYDLVKQAYMMGIEHDLNSGRRKFNQNWHNGFCLIRYFTEVMKLASQ